MVVLRPQRRALIMPSRSFFELKKIAQKMTEGQKKEMLGFLYGKHTQHGLEVEKHNVLPEAQLKVGQKPEVFAGRNCFKIPGGVEVGEGMVHSHVDDTLLRQVPKKLVPAWKNSPGQRKLIPSKSDALWYKSEGGYVLMLGGEHKAYYVQGTSVREVPLVLKPHKKPRIVPAQG